MKIYRPAFFRFGCALLVFAFCMALSACNAPSFLTDLEQVIPVALTAVTGILGIIGSLNPEAAAVAALLTPIISKVETGLTEIEKLVKQYQSEPGEPLLEQIEGLINTAVADLKSLLTVEGVPAAAAASISAVVAAVVAQLEALVSALPLFKSATAGQTLTVTKPVSAAAFKAQIKTALAAKA